MNDEYEYFSNITGLHSNLNDFHYHLDTVKLLALFTETQISSPTDTSYLSYPRSILSIHLNQIRAYIREGISSRRLTSLGGRGLSILWLGIDCDDHPCIYAYLHRNAESDRLFEHLHLMTDSVLQQILSTEITIVTSIVLDCLYYRSCTEICFRFYLYGLTQIVLTQTDTLLTRVLDIDNLSLSLLKFLLTSA